MPTRAFTLSEVLVVILIISIMSSLSLKKIPTLNFDEEIFISEYHLSLAKAMAKKETISLTHPFSPYPLSFNQNGTINRAVSLAGHKHELIAHLGSSYLTYEN